MSEASTSSGTIRRPRSESAGAARAALLVLLAAAPWGGCGGPDENRPGESTLERIRRTGVVRVGYANEAPYAYLDSTSDRLTGEAPEIARAVLGRMDVPKIEGVLTEFGALIPGLKAGRFDMIAAGMYITPTRCKEIDFSDPTYCIGEGFLVKAGNPYDLHSYDDARGTTRWRSAWSPARSSSATARRSASPGTGSWSSRTHRAPSPGSSPGGWTPTPAPSSPSATCWRKADDPGLEVAEPFTNPVIDGKTTQGCGAFGFRPDDDAFREAFEEQLHGFIGSPEHLELVDPSASPPKTSPGDVTATKLCKAGG